MKDAKVSIIIPCYNMEKYLQNCFLSLDNQDYTNLEIIFIDDGSTDNTLPLLLKYCENKKNCRVISQKNMGLASARNTGLRNCTGDYIYFFDPDDMLAPNTISTAVKYSEANNCDLFIFGFHRIKEKNYTDIKFHTKPIKKLYNYDKLSAIEQYLSQNIFFSSVWNKLYKTSILKDNNIFFVDGCRYSEDTYFNYVYLLFTNKITYANAKMYYYVNRNNSLTHDGFKESRLDAFLSLNYILMDSKNNASIHGYAHALRCFQCCEYLYFIKKSKYNKVNVINYILSCLKESTPYLKKCKKVTLFRRMAIPLVYPIAKLFLRNQIKNGDKSPLPKVCTTILN